jgi:hypothetical protein
MVELTLENVSGPLIPIRKFNGLAFGTVDTLPGYAVIDVDNAEGEKLLEEISGLKIDEHRTLQLSKEGGGRRILYMSPVGFKFEKPINQK